MQGSNNLNISENNNTSGLKTHALVSYILMTLGLFTAIPLLVGAIWAMIKRSSSKGTIYHSHYTNAIRVFWWSLLWAIIGWATTVVLIGFGILAIAWLWAVYRLVLGLAKILDDEIYPL